MKTMRDIDFDYSENDDPYETVEDLVENMTVREILFDSYSGRLSCNSKYISSFFHAESCSSIYFADILIPDEPSSQV